MDTQINHRKAHVRIGVDAEAEEGSPDAARRQHQIRAEKGLLDDHVPEAAVQLRLQQLLLVLLNNFRYSLETRHAH